MADSIVDVIHRLSYQVDTGGISFVIGKLQQTYKEAEKVKQTINSLEQDLKKLGKSADPADIQIRKQIIQQIEEQRKKVQELTVAAGKYAIENEAQLTKELGLIRLLSAKYADLSEKRRGLSSPSEIARVNSELEVISNKLLNLSGLGVNSKQFGFVTGLENQIRKLSESAALAKTEEEFAAINDQIGILQRKLSLLRQGSQGLSILEIEAAEKSIIALQDRIEEIKALTASGVLPDEEVQRLNTEMLQLSALMGDYRRKIDAATASMTNLGKKSQSNYEAQKKFVTGNLGFAFSQIVRETPSLALSPATYFLAISNNIPILLDQLKEARAAGLNTAGVFSAMGRALFGFTGIITIAITLLTIFSDRIFANQKSAKELRKEYEGLGDEIDKLIEKYDALIKASENAADLGTNAIKRELEAIKARGVIQDQVFKSEFDQFTKSQELREKELSDLQDRNRLYTEAVEVLRKYKGDFMDLKTLNQTLQATPFTITQRDANGNIVNQTNPISATPESGVLKNIVKEVYDEAVKEKLKSSEIQQRIEERLVSKILEIREKEKDKTSEILNAQTELVAKARTKEYELTVELLERIADLRTEQANLENESYVEVASRIQRRIEIERDRSIQKLDKEIEKTGKLLITQDKYNELLEQLDEQERNRTINFEEYQKRKAELESVLNDATTVEQKYQIVRSLIIKNAELRLSKELDEYHRRRLRQEEDFRLKLAQFNLKNTQEQLDIYEARGEEALKLRVKQANAQTKFDEQQEEVDYRRTLEDLDREIASLENALKRRSDIESESYKQDSNLLEALRNDRIDAEAQHLERLININSQGLQRIVDAHKKEYENLKRVNDDYRSFEVAMSDASYSEQVDKLVDAYNKREIRLGQLRRRELKFQWYQETERLRIQKEADERSLRAAEDNLKNLSDLKRKNDQAVSQSQIDAASAEVNRAKASLSQSNRALSLRGRAPSGLERFLLGAEANNFATAEERRQAAIEKSIQLYQELTQAALDSVNLVYQAQVDKIDREISYRESRMDYAIELSRRGNVELLNQERDRLEALKRKREEIANRQLFLDSLMRASSAALTLAQSLQTVANAGATGDPYSTAGRIAAAVAALAAGFAAVMQLKQSFSTGFSDGGYTGDGGKYEPAGIVHKGEVVFSQKDIARLGGVEVVEALRLGAMPYASVRDSSQQRMDGIEDRLDTLIEVMSEEHTTVHNRMDERGWLSMTERARRKDRNRFR